MERSHSGGSARNLARWFTVLCVLAFLLMVVRNAWLSDDAYITFRTVDNFVNGYGLTWNVVERVQAYTHPLWMLLMSGLYFFTREIYFSSLLFSIALSLLTVILLAFRLARSPMLACLGLVVLVLSKAFVDYATSGLENPLTHLLFVLFLIVYFSFEDNLNKLFLLSLIAAFGIVNRQDTCLLYVPGIVYVFLHVRHWKGLVVIVLGFMPVALWELFSLFYYGSFFPNTAYAKLNAALISRSDLIHEGLTYLHNSLVADPITLFVIALGSVLPLVTREWRKLPIALGCVLYLAYVVYVGGDFMSGRFMTAPLLGSVVVLVNSNLGKFKLAQGILFILFILMGLLAPYSPVFATGENGARTGFEASWVRGRGIIDERANYYHNTGLLRAFQQDKPLPDHDWALEGRAARIEGPAVIEKGSVGFFGYFAGPQVYVIDILGLGNPLLARLPPAEPDWVVGHLGRVVPDGYVETLQSGQNKLRDPNLATYYDKLSFVIRADLFDKDRLREIWKLNTGAYDHHLDAYAYYQGQTFSQRFRVSNPTDRPYVVVYVWNNQAGEGFLLDDASARDKTYDVQWRIARDSVEFEGNYQRKLSSIGQLSDAETLNMGVIFSPQPDLQQQDMFEYRYWFTLEQNGDIVVVLPPKGWHNPEAPGGYWVAMSLEGVLSSLNDNADE